MYRDSAMAKKMGRPKNAPGDNKDVPLMVKTTPANNALYHAAHKKSHPNMSYSWFINWIIGNYIDGMIKGGWSPDLDVERWLKEQEEKRKR